MYKITGTSPSGHTWHHSSHYPNAIDAAKGLAKAVVLERQHWGWPVKPGSHNWEMAERMAYATMPGESITLPNGWTFTIETQEETVTQ